MGEAALGELTVTQHPDGNVTAEWTGPKYVKISQELMHQAPQGQEVFKRNGDTVTVCQFTLRIIGRDVQGDYIAERIEGA